MDPGLPRRPRLEGFFQRHESDLVEADTSADETIAVQHIPHYVRPFLTAPSARGVTLLPDALRGMCISPATLSAVVW